MRTLALPLLVLVAVGCGNERKETPRPRIVAVSVAADSTTGLPVALSDSATWKVTYVLDRSPRTAANGGPDTVRINLRRDSTSATAPLVSYGFKFRFLQRDTSSFQVPKVFGQIAKYTTCVQVRKTTIIVPNSCRSWQTNYAAKVDTTPPAHIDSVLVDSVVGVLVKPDSVKVTRADWEAVGVYTVSSQGLYGKAGTKLAWTCPSGGTGKCPQKEFCTFVRLSGGAVAMTANSSTITTCRTIFNQIPGHLPTYAPAVYYVEPGDLW